MDFDFTTDSISPTSSSILATGGTGALDIPVGTTLERPGTASSGCIRFNTTVSALEFYNGATWLSLTSGSAGTVTSIDISGGTTGLTTTGGPITSSGTITLTLAGGGSLVTSTSPGAVLQRVTNSIPATTSTTVITIGNTAPTATQGTQIWTQTFTPKSSTSKMLIEFQVGIDTSTNGITGICAIFRGTTCIGVLSAPRGGSVTAYITDLPATTSAITYSARVGPTGSGTAYINQLSGGTFGSAMVSIYSIQEIAA